MNDSSAMFLIFSLLKVQIENLSLNKDDRECRKDIKTLERTECKTLFINCISSTVHTTDRTYNWTYNWSTVYTTENYKFFEIIA